ncbi:MerR family transcriptional regulator [Priestia koreensis]|uniref:MerR family transcriptional regulator n=1 Tax=Priestia koreensis TaxID=284581 RepID=UPI0034590486
MQAYTMKEAAKKIKVPPRIIKQWEKDLEGLLLIPRTKQGARFYTDAELLFLKELKELYSKKYSKEEIQSYVRKAKGIKKEEQIEKCEEAYTEPPSPSPLVNIDEVDVDTILESAAAEEVMQEEPSCEVVSSLHEEEMVEQETKRVEASVPTDIVQAELIQTVQNFKDVFEAFHSFKEELIQEVRNEIRNEVRNEILGDVRNEITKGTEQTYEMMETVGSFIAESSERTADEMKGISKKLIRSQESNFEEMSYMLENISETTEQKTEVLQKTVNEIHSSQEGQKEEMRSLLNKLTDASHKDLDEVKQLVQEMSELSDDQSQELKDLIDYISKSSEENSKEVRYILDRFSSSSTVAMNQVKFLVESMSKTQKQSETELHDLLDSIHEERIYYYEQMDKERKEFRQDIASRERMFNDFVQTFRQTAAATEKKAKWWKFW